VSGDARMLRRVVLAGETDFAGWRDHARALLLARIPPEQVIFSTAADDGGDLFGSAAASGLPSPAADVPAVTVPRAFMQLAETALLHSDPQRFAYLYRLLWRLQVDRRLMEQRTDADVALLENFAKSVRRDIHKMHAFVRFREIAAEDGPRFVAWFEPEHHTIEAGTPFFVRRFAAMRWSILSPRLCAHWDLHTLVFSPGASKRDAPAEDAMEDAWRVYYASIFNPARLKVDAMRAEMPKKYWRNLPEAGLIEPLIRSATQRAGEMVAAQPSLAKSNPQRLAAPAVLAAPSAGTLEALRAEAADCRACPLWKPATQTVFGEGPRDARVLFLGEQPGDREDLSGKPFVGPAGQLFDRAMGAAGLDRSAVYVTNAVKHFKFVPRGKKRIHSTPNSSEIQACRPWFDRELELISPNLVVAMGATAIHSLFGRTMPVGKNRGRILEGPRGAALVTVHPSYLLRLPDPAAREDEYDRFVEDLRLAGPFLAGQTAA
jgi:uracil-DNA glycosylase